MTLFGRGGDISEPFQLGLLKSLKGQRQGRSRSRADSILRAFEISENWA